MRELDRLNIMFDVSLYVLVILPIAMIALGGSVPLVMGLLFIAALPTSWWVHHRGLARTEHAVWFNTVVLLFLAVTGIQLAVTELTLLDGGIRFVIVLTVIKLFSRLSERDEMQLFALSFLGLAAATTVNEELTFGLLFGVYVLLGTFALAVFHLRSELAARPRLALRRGAATLNRAYIGVLLGMGGLILGASLSIFFVFPRLGLGFFAPQDRPGVSVAGFSDEVELGGHGAIRDNPEVVMRVEILDRTGLPPLDTIHWRTLSFDQYDGRRWSRTLPGRGRALSLSGDVTDLSRLHQSGEPGARLRIYLEPIGKNVLPVVRPSHSLRLGTTKYVLQWGPRAGFLRRDWYDDIHHTIESEVGIAYVLTLARGVVPAVDGQREPPQEFLQLPVLSPRVRELATRVTRDAGTHAEKANAITEHLQTSYRYTTDLPEVGSDPIDAFLFDTQQGHCEYFATASVLMLRANGVPARLVNGFLGGQWNAVGDYLAVRQGDAHSWAEYWDPQTGWTQIDPTPATDAVVGGAALETARATWDAMRLAWMKWVIEYDLNAQVEVFRNIAALIQPRGLMEERSTDKPESTTLDGDWRRALFLAGLATLMFLGFQRTRRRLRRRKRPLGTAAAASVLVGMGAGWTGWFQGFETVNLVAGGGLVALAVVGALASYSRKLTLQSAFETVERAAGHAREPGEGPQTYLHRLAAQQPGAAGELRRFAAHYLRARFGSIEPVDHQQVIDLHARAERIAEKLRKNN